jgi:hypothetical protein
MPDDRRPDSGHDWQPADTGERKVLGAIRRAMGQEPAQVQRRSGYRGPGTRHEERRDNGMSAWAKVGLGYVIPALLLASWVGSVHQQVIDLRSERAGHELRRKQLETAERRIANLEQRIEWLERTRGDR